ncbi:riboflavin kinase [Kineococcus sp. SYSU DK002]|uniref:riboflavin kinase n=1 Tax=Kineococcus sp. SYSU DK002 TaxID=3383123 RepID=UPI003D7CBDA4
MTTTRTTTSTGPGAPGTRGFPGSPGSPRPAVPRPRDTAAGVALVVSGVVEHGDERGRLLGFPTANVAVPGHGLRDGVWAGTVQVDPGGGGALHVAAVSVGHRPTFYGRDGHRLLEAHLLDFTGDLYDRTVEVRLHVRLRPQRRFDGTDGLVAQVHRDVAGTRAWAAGAGLGHLVVGCRQ